MERILATNGNDSFVTMSLDEMANLIKLGREFGQELAKVGLRLRVEKVETAQKSAVPENASHTEGQ